MAKPTQAEVHDVFISYKRSTAAAQARLIRADLTQNGLRVFMDVTDLGSGFFDESLLERITNTRNFVVILAPHALDNCMEEGDWLRREIRQAIAARCNIVPIRLRDFQFPREMPDDIRDLPRYQSIEYSHEFFEAMVDRLVDMLEKPAGVGKLRRAAGRPQEAGARRVSRALLWWSIAAVALLAAAGFGFEQYQSKKATDAQIVKLINTAYGDFHKALDAPPTARQPYAAAVQSDIDSILRLDPRNGVGLYYLGSLKRLSNPDMFKGSCIVSAKLGGQASELEAYEDDFQRYLDVASGLPASETGGKADINLCYSRPNGYCPQRTAWISHLLANDLYQEALLQGDRNMQINMLNRARDEANRALGLYQDDHGRRGFTQCIPTDSLVAMIQEHLQSAAK